MDMFPATLLNGKTFQTHTLTCTHRMAWFKLWKTTQRLVQSLWGDTVCMCGETPGKVQKSCEWYPCLLSSSPHAMVGYLSNLFPSAGVSAMTTYLTLLYGWNSADLTQPNHNEVLLCNVYRIVQVFLAGLLYYTNDTSSLIFLHVVNI